MDNKLIFDDVEELVSHMFDIVEIDESVTVIADKDLSVDVMQELLTYKDVILDIASVDSYEYDKEYRVTLALSEDDDCWHVLIDPAYNDYQDKYFGIGGHLLFHEDINSKAQVNILNNNYVDVLDYNWFVIGEDNSFESDETYDEKDNTDNEETDATENNNLSNTPYTNCKMIYKINGQEVDKETYEKASREIDKLYYDGIRDILDSFWRIF